MSAAGRAHCGDLVENARDIILEVDLEERFVAVNPAFERVLGYAASEVVGHPIESIVAPEWCAQVRDATFVKLRAPDEPTLYDVELVAADGRRIPVEVSSWLVLEGGEPVAVQAICRDVGERVATERALREVEEALGEREELLRRAFDETVVGLVVVSAEDGRIERANEAFCSLVGYSEEELTALTVADLTHPDDREETLRSIVGLRGRAFRRYRNEKRYVRRDGEVVRVQIGVSPVHDERGEVASLIAQVVDVTARRESEERFRRLFEQSPQGMDVVTRDGRIVEANAALARMLGYAPEELVGMTVTEITHPEDVSADLERFERVMSGGVPYFEMEKRMRRKDGVFVAVHLTSFALPNPSGKPELAFGLIEDITERRRLERELLVAHRMEAIGQLAGGVAHDFNNLLTAIASYCDLADDALDAESDPRLRSSMDGIRSAAVRAADMTRQLLAFSRMQVLELESLDLNAVVSAQSGLLQRLLGEDVRMELVLDEDVDAVSMDPGQLGQVVMNLAVNARDAMPDGGTLTIATENVELDDAQTTSGVISGRFVRLTVSDTGCGMDGETVARIFEPFFTTKDPSRGTGLGLSTVVGIVEQSGGRVGVYTEPGLGTTFTVYMPSAGPSPARESVPAAAVAPERPTGTGRILLVEDNDAVRRPVVRLLADLGYDVLEADGPESALELATEDVDLLVTDVVMPAMNGRQLAERLLERQPSLKVLYMSGYADDAVIARGIVEPGTAFLQKPFGADRLAQMICGLLG